MSLEYASCSRAYSICGTIRQLLTTDYGPAKYQGHAWCHCRSYRYRRVVLVNLEILADALTIGVDTRYFRQRAQDKESANSKGRGLFLANQEQRRDRLTQKWQDREATFVARATALQNRFPEACECCSPPSFR